MPTLASVVLHLRRNGRKRRSQREGAWLCSTEQSLEQPGLPVQVVTGDPEYLPFPNHIRRLDSLNGRPRCRRRAWPLHRSQPPLHVAVIGFDPVITIKARTLPTTLPHATLAPQLSNCRRIAPQAVSGKHMWWWIVRIGHR